MTNREYVKYHGIKFYRHPFSEDYLASKNGKILSLKWNKKRILKLRLTRFGYLDFCLSEKNKKRQYFVHRFVYECFKGEIPKGMQTDHIDNNKKNNSINNLQILSPKENHHKSHCKKVVSFNVETKEEKIFNSLKEASEFYKIIDSSITLNCQKKYKTCKSKKDGQRFKFFYL